MSKTEKYEVKQENDDRQKQQQEHQCIHTVHVNERRIHNKHTDYTRIHI